MKQASKQASKFEPPWRLRSRPSWRRPSERRIARGATGHRAPPLSSPAPSPPLSPPPFLSERSGGGSAEKRDRSCGAGWGCAARRGRSDHGCSHCGWLGIHRGCSRRGQAAAVAIAEVCMPSLCPSHPIACHSSAQARMPLGARVGVCIPSLCPCHSIACHSSTHATPRCARRCARAPTPLA